MEIVRERRYEVLDNESVVDTFEGEVISFQEFNQRIKAEQDLIESEARIVREKKNKLDGIVQNWNQKGRPTMFSKNYEVYQKMMMENMSLLEIGLMNILSINIEYITNEVLLNGNPPTNDDLLKITGVGTGTLKGLLKSLEDKNLICRTGRGSGRRIYVSPYWAIKGKNISSEVVDMFNNK